MVNIPKNKVLMFVPSVQKIMDITAAEDDAVHTCTIAAYVPPNAVILIGLAIRAGGSGTLGLYPDEHASHSIQSSLRNEEFSLPISNQQIKYKKSASGDDFDLWMHGYYVEGPVGE